MKWVGKICISLSVALLLLHTLLPHEHHTGLPSVEHIAQHENADGLLDYIRLAFHLDQGEGHLESYQVISGYSSLLTATVAETATYDFLLGLVENREIAYAVYQDTLPDHSFFPSLRFRGPPIHA